SDLKLIDVVRITDLTRLDHIERELALLKLQVDSDEARDAVTRVLEQFDARLLDDRSGHLTVELVGGSKDIDRFVERVSRAARVATAVRSGGVAMRPARA